MWVIAQGLGRRTRKRKTSFRQKLTSLNCVFVASHRITQHLSNCRVDLMRKWLINANNCCLRENIALKSSRALLVRLQAHWGFNIAVVEKNIYIKSTNLWHHHRDLSVAGAFVSCRCRQLFCVAVAFAALRHISDFRHVEKRWRELKSFL